MVTVIQNLINVRLWRRNREQQTKQAAVVSRTPQLVSPVVDIAPNDPIVAYFLSTPGAVEVDKLQMDSPASRNLKKASVKIVIPLVSQGELVGLLNLGPRRSEQVVKD